MTNESAKKTRQERPVLRAVLAIVAILLVVELLHFGLYKLGVVDGNHLFVNVNVRVSTHTQLNGE